MIPSIFPGDLIGIKALDNDLKIGSIYLYQSSNKLIIHRLAEISALQNTVITLGDNNDLPDPPIHREQILGQVKLIRKSYRHHLNKIWYTLLKALN